jgi:hypothetical protein
MICSGKIKTCQATPHKIFAYKIAKLYTIKVILTVRTDQYYITERAFRFKYMERKWQY